MYRVLPNHVTAGFVLFVCGSVCEPVPFSLDQYVSTLAMCPNISSVNVSVVLVLCILPNTPRKTVIDRMLLEQCASLWNPDVRIDRDYLLLMSISSRHPSQHITRYAETFYGPAVFLQGLLTW